MKIWIVLLSLAGGAVLLFSGLESTRNVGADASTPFLVLSRTPVPEIPAKAADLVHEAADANREETARDVLRAVAVVARPGVLRYVISAVCGANPEVAGTVVATAVGLEPDDVLVFCQAALCAAPSKAEQIVFGACRGAPSSSAAVALTACRLMPAAHDLILAGFANALPELELYVEKAEVQVGPDFQVVIERTVELFNAAPDRRGR